MDVKVKGYSLDRLLKFKEFQSAYMVQTIEGEEMEIFEYYIPEDKVAEFEAAGGLMEEPGC